MAIINSLRLLNFTTLLAPLAPAVLRLLLSHRVQQDHLYLALLPLARQARPTVAPNTTSTLLRISMAPSLPDGSGESTLLVGRIMLTTTHGAPLGIGHRRIKL
jgi:hypothetical protein